MPQALEANGVSWKIYQVPGSQTTDSFTDNVMFYFKPFRDPSSVYFQKGMLPAFPGDFQSDVAAGTLPQVSWLAPTSPLDEHPPAPAPIGELFTIRQVLATLVSNPAVWERTVLFLTYDENGGFFDHVAPPTAPMGTPEEWLTTKPAIGGNIGPNGSVIDGPIGLGFRVPMLVLSPFSVGGLVCSDTFDCVNPSVNRLPGSDPAVVTASRVRNCATPQRPYLPYLKEAHRHHGADCRATTAPTGSARSGNRART